MPKGQKRTKKSTKTGRTKRSTARKTQKTKRTTATKRRTVQKSKSGNSYKNYMKKAISQVKTDNPTLSHTDAFKLATQQWATSSENPKNK